MHMQSIQYSEIPKLQTKTSQRKEDSINKNNGNNKSHQFHSQHFDCLTISCLRSFNN